ncbi:MAG: alpha/beta hydrolase [Candidatus Eremiobacteraeota bacterium]|nr:alpha/beta hydrolase [Candidatus Eremiobacteraeota bacterium]
MAVLLIPAVFLLLLCVWIVIPPFNGLTIGLAVGSIELSVYMLALNVLLFGATLLRRGRQDVAAEVVLAANCIICSLPSLALAGASLDRTALYRNVNVPITERAISVTLGREHGQIQAYLPVASRRTPAIFAVYGGAWRNGTPHYDAALNRGLAHQGYAVFALDYRHAPKYRFPAALDDVRSEATFIRKNAARYNINPSATGMLGHSSGGELAALVAFDSRSAARALISYSGAIDLSMGWKYPPVPDPIGIRAVIEGYIGDIPARAPDRYRAASLLGHVRRGLPPVLLIYGTRDHVVDIRYAWKFRDALRAVGTRVTFVQLPWTEHAFEAVPFGLHAPVAYRATLNFLASTLR